MHGRYCELGFLDYGPSHRLLPDERIAESIIISRPQLTNTRGYHNTVGSPTASEPIHSEPDHPSSGFPFVLDPKSSNALIEPPSLETLL
jgi:hypothetical protein